MRELGSMLCTLFVATSYYQTIAPLWGVDIPIGLYEEILK